MVVSCPQDMLPPLGFKTYHVRSEEEKPEKLFSASSIRRAELVQETVLDQGEGQDFTIGTGVSERANEIR